MTLLPDIDALLLAELGSLPEPGRTGAIRVVGAGGKRLRPELVVRCAEAGSVTEDQTLVTAAAAVELLHSATLVHDDLLDDSDTRRGVVAVHRQEGPGAAVIVGDALIALSWQLIATAHRSDILDLAQALAKMCAGQALEEQLRFRPSAEPLDVLRVAQLKTGALLRAACRIGARQGGYVDGVVQAFGDFGSDFGVALQLVDDVLDVISDAALLGKPVGADFAAGTMTMPAVLAMDATPRLAELLRPDLPPAELDTVEALLVSSGGVDRSVALARAFARRAARALLSLPDLGSDDRARTERIEAISRLPLEYVERQLADKTAAPHRPLVRSEGRAAREWASEGMTGATGDHDDARTLALLGAAG